jgi:hypothetical protein
MAKPIIVRLYNPPVLPMMFGIATIPQMVGSVLGLPPYSCFFPSNHPILRNLPSNPIFRCQFKLPSSIDPENQVLVVSLIFQPLPWSNCWCQMLLSPGQRAAKEPRAGTMLAACWVNWWTKPTHIIGACWKVQLICHKTTCYSGVRELALNPSIFDLHFHSEECMMVFMFGNGSLGRDIWHPFWGGKANRKPIASHIKCRGGARGRSLQGPEGAGGWTYIEQTRMNSPVKWICRFCCSEFG